MSTIRWVWSLLFGASIGFGIYCLTENWQASMSFGVAGVSFLAFFKNKEEE